MEKIQEGFDIFTHDGEKAFGAVRKVLPHGILIYIENAGDFEISADTIQAVHDGKVVLDSGKLDTTLTEAIRRAHAGEDPRI